MLPPEAAQSDTVEKEEAADHEPEFLPEDTGSMALVHPEISESEKDEVFVMDEVKNEEENPSADVRMPVLHPDGLDSVLEESEQTEQSVENTNAVEADQGVEVTNTNEE